jgi:hypothetical protein
MPSGIATTAVAAAIAIGALWPKARVVDVDLRRADPASRVVIQAHFVSDVSRPPSSAASARSLCATGSRRAPRFVPARRRGAAHARAVLAPRQGGCPPAARPIRTPPARFHGSDARHNAQQRTPRRFGRGSGAQRGRQRRPLADEIAAALSGRWSFELIFVNDGSTDGPKPR